MSTTYLEIVNDVLSEMTEVLLTDSNFSNAVNIQRTVKEMVNRAYMDINNPVFRWPWLATATSQNDFYGNTYVETVAGQRWYLLDPTSSDYNDDYGHVDWDQFALTTEGVAGETEPYTVRMLQFITQEEWRDRYQTSEDTNKYDSSSNNTPLRVIRNPDGRRFGLSPLPDKVYRIYFFAWDRPVRLSLSTDTIAIPDQYYGVLLARARYYAWQRKENPNQAQIAFDEYRAGLRGMRQQEVERTPDRFTDSRIRY